MDMRHVTCGGNIQNTCAHLSTGQSPLCEIIKYPTDELEDNHQGKPWVEQSTVQSRKSDKDW